MALRAPQNVCTRGHKQCQWGTNGNLFSSFPSSMFTLTLRPRKAGLRGGEGLLRVYDGDHSISLGEQLGEHEIAGSLDALRSGPLPPPSTSSLRTPAGLASCQYLLPSA